MLCWASVSYILALCPIHNHTRQENTMAQTISPFTSLPHTRSLPNHLGGYRKITPFPDIRNLNYSKIQTFSPRLVFSSANTRRPWVLSSCRYRLSSVLCSIQILYLYRSLTIETLWKSVKQASRQANGQLCNQRGCKALCFARSLITPCNIYPLYPSPA